MRASRTFRQTIAVITAGALLSASLNPLAPAHAATTAVDYAKCQVDNEDAFRAEIERLTMAALGEGLKTVDYTAIVADEWRRNDMGKTVDASVDKAITEIREEASWTALLETLASREAAQKLATDVAERTYRSDAMKVAIEQLAVDVGKQLASRIELATLDAGVPAVACVRAFLGPRYGSTISLLVAGDTAKEFEVRAEAGSAEVSSGDVALSSKGLMAGAVVLIVRRSLSNMAKRVGQRVVGAVLGRLVSVVAGGIGLILIAKDIWDLRNGVLPIIEAEMKSDETKEKVRIELAAAISEQLGTHLNEVGASTADRILAVWREFKGAHSKVVELTERHAEFKSFMDTVQPDHLPRVDRIVALVLPREGEAGLLKRLGDGSLDEAVKRFSDAALDIANDTQSLAVAMDWARLAGSAIDKVVDHELHRAAAPADFTEASLQALLAVGDDGAVRTLVGLPRGEREALQRVEPVRLRKLASAVGRDELGTLARYLAGLEPEVGLRLLSAVTDDPTRMKVFGKGYVETAVLGSDDQAAAVAMLLRSGPLIDTLNLQSDVQMVLDGRVHPLLMWQKHPMAIGVLALLMLFLLLMMRRMLFARRR